MSLKMTRQSVCIEGFLSLCAATQAQAMTWDEWNQSSSPFCGFISIFCAPKPVVAQAVVVSVAPPVKSGVQRRSLRCNRQAKPPVAIVELRVSFPPACQEKQDHVIDVILSVTMKMNS